MVWVGRGVPSREDPYAQCTEPSGLGWSIVRHSTPRYWDIMGGDDLQNEDNDKVYPDCQCGDTPRSVDHQGAGTGDRPYEKVICIERFPVQSSDKQAYKVIGRKRGTACQSYPLLG